MSQTELLRDLLLSQPGQWVPMPKIAATIGAYAVHSRIAELRSDTGMHILNRQCVIDGKRHSFYRYDPPESPTA